MPALEFEGPEGMKTALHPMMAEALKLTRAGKLTQATALIQATLRGAAPEAAVMAPRAPVDPLPDDVILSSMRHATRSSEGAIPDGRSAAAPRGSFIECCYKGSGGRLSYRLYVPADARAGMPLVIMLHGCTQSPEDFALGTGMNLLADEMGFLVAYPRQTSTSNPQRCWNWFKPGDQKRDRGEPALIAGVTRKVIAGHAVDPRRVYVAGLSAGGAAAAIMGSAYPDVYAAIGVHSGLACGAARDLPGAMMAMRNGRGPVSPSTAGPFVPVITFHGDRDATVHDANSGAIIAAASAAFGGQLRKRSEIGRSVGGRTFKREVSIDRNEQVLIEQWTIQGTGHAWSGGDAAGSYTDPAGPSASREMLRFFLTHAR